MAKDAYKQAGVDIAAGEAAVAKIADMAAQQKDPNVLSGIGGFGSLYALPTGYQHPVLVSGSDGVGTKLLLAITAQRFTGIGEDLVAMCVNDILAQGALPLYFLDYLGIHQVVPAQVAKIVQSIQVGCTKGQLALIGGETAEMPDMYAQDHYDLAGFAVGLAEKDKLLVAENVKAGDRLLGLKSSGLHSNGYSLVRQILFKAHDFKLTDQVLTSAQTLADVLLTPTRIYTAALKPLLQAGFVAGAAHITGGGLVENLPRSLPKNLAAQIDQEAWQIPEVFKWLQKLGDLSRQDMLQTFNLGIGFVLIVHPEHVAAVKTNLAAQQETVIDLGTVIPRQEQAVAFTGSGQL